MNPSFAEAVHGYLATTYSGRRFSTGCQVFVHRKGGSAILNPRLDLRNHSPDGFNWGYGGSGPAQLALALLADVASDEMALRYYQRFKSAFVANLVRDQWITSLEEILHWLKLAIDLDLEDEPEGGAS